MPFPETSFGACVRVVYFWSDLDAALREITRIIKPDGRLAMVFRSSATDPAVQAFPSGVDTFPAIEDVIAAMTSAGSSSDDQACPVQLALSTMLVAVKGPALEQESEWCRSAFLFGDDTGTATNIR